MHSKKIYVTLLSITLFITSCQKLITDPSNASNTPTVTSQGGYKTWGETYNDFGLGVFQTADGGYAVVGSQYTDDVTQSDLVLVQFKTDLTPVTGSEKVLTMATFSGTENTLSYSDTGNDFIQTADGGFAIVGQTFNGTDYDVLVVKYAPSTSSGFTLNWSVKIDGNDLGNNDYGNSIIQKEDGGFVVCGTTFDGNDEDIMLWEINVAANEPTATELWDSESAADNGLKDFGNHAEQTSDGGYIVVGTTSTGIKIVKLIYDSTSSTYILDTNFSGDGEHILTTGAEGNFVQQTNSGDYIVAGNVQGGTGAQADVVLFHVPNDVATDGTGIVSTTLGGSYNDNASSIIQTNDGGYAFTGSKYTENRASELWAVKLTPGLTVVWEKTYGGLLNDNGASIKEANDGGYIIAGSTMTNDKQSQFLILKIESDGCVWDSGTMETCGN